MSVQCITSDSCDISMENIQNLITIESNFHTKLIWKSYESLYDNFGIVVS